MHAVSTGMMQVATRIWLIPPLFLLFGKPSQHSFGLS